MGLIKQKIGGVVSTGPQQLANFWNIDLKNLNKGFENSYQNLLPDNATMEEALFNTVLENLTSYDGITRDENGNIFMQTNKNISKPSISSGPEGPLDYRVNTLQEVITLNSKQPSSAIASVMKKLTNKELYSKDEVYDVWLNSAPAAELNSAAPTNAEHYRVEKQDPREAFNKMPMKGELFEVKNGRVVGIGDYDLSKAQDRFEYVLNNLSSAERKKMENLSSLRALAWAADWRVENPQIIPAEGVARTKDNYETMEEYIARMKAAYKKQFKRDYPSN